MKAILLVVAFIIVGIILGGWFFSGFTMSSDAMEPTFAKGKMIFYSRKVRTFGRGSIVLVQVPDAETQAVRRIIGLPGEKVEYRAGEMFINDQKVEEKYLKMMDKEGPQIDSTPPPGFGPVTVPEFSYFVLGDNRKTARDSRTFGFILEQDIIGRVWALWGVLVF